MDHLHHYQRRRVNHQQLLPPHFSDDFRHLPPPQHHHLPPPPHPLSSNYHLRHEVAFVDSPLPPSRDVAAHDFSFIDRNRFDFRQTRVPPPSPPSHHHHHPRFPPLSPVVNRQVVDFHDYLSPTPPFIDRFSRDLNSPRLLSDEFDVDPRIRFRCFDSDRSRRSMDDFEREEEFRRNVVYDDWRGMNDFEREELLRCRIDERRRITDDLQKQEFIRHSNMVYRDELLHCDRVRVNDERRIMEDGFYRDLDRPEVLFREPELLFREPELILGGCDYAVDKVGSFRDENVPVNLVRNGNFDARSDVLRSPIVFQGREIEGEVRFPEFYDEGTNRVPVVRHVGFDARSDVLHSPFEFRGREVEGEGRFPEINDERINRELYVDRGRRERDWVGEDVRECYDHESRKNSPRKLSAFHRLQPPIKHSSTFRNRLDKTTTSPHKGREINVESLGHKSNGERSTRPVDLNVSFNCLVGKANIGVPSSSKVDGDGNFGLSDLDTKTVGESPLRARRSRNRGTKSPVPKKEDKQSDNQVRASPILMKVGIRKIAELPDNRSKSSASGGSGLFGDGNVCCMASPEGEVLRKDGKKDSFSKESTASPPSDRKKRKAFNLISRLSISVPTNSDTGVAVDNSFSSPSGGSMSNAPGSLEDGRVQDESRKSNLGDDVTKFLAKCSRDIALKTGCGENQGSSEHMVVSLGPTNSVTCDVDTAVITENKAYLANSDVNVSEPHRLSPECNIAGQQCRNVDMDDDDNEAESSHSGDEMKLVYSPNMNLSNGDSVSTDCMKMPIISDIEIMNGIQEQQCTDTGSILVNDKARKRRKLSLNPCVSKGGNFGHLAFSSVKTDAFSPNKKRKARVDVCDADSNNFPDNSSKKIRSIALDSVFNKSVTESCDLCASPNISKSIASGPLYSVNNSEQAAGGLELSNSLLPPEDVVVEATSVLQTGISVFGDGSKVEVQHKDSHSPVDETSLSSYISESECNRKDGGILIGAVNLLGNELIGSDSEFEMAKRYRNSGVHCIQPSYSTDLNGAPFVTDMECESNITVEGNLATLSEGPFLRTEPTLEIVTNKPVMLDKLSKVNSLGALPQVTPTFGISSPIHTTSDDIICRDSKKSESLKSLGDLISQSKFVHGGFQKNVKPGNLAAPSNQPFTQKAAPVPSKYAKKPVSISSSTSRQFSWRNELTHGKTTISSSQPSPVTTFSKKSLPTVPVKPRTWRRVDNLAASNTTMKNPSSSMAPPQKPPCGKSLKVQDASYVRKGNSLVRNSGCTTALGSHALSASISQAKPIDVNKNGKLKGSGTTNSTESPNCLTTGGRQAPIEMPKIHPLPCSDKTPDCKIAYVGDCTSQLQAERFGGMDNTVSLKATETALSLSGNPDVVLDQSLMDNGNLSDGVIQASKVMKVVYIKRKANQLIAAASTSPELSGRNMDKKLGLSSDNSYFKRRKNQLIRASSESNIQKMVSAAVDSSNNSRTQKAFSVYSSRSASKGPSRRVKSSKVSLVWKLGDAKSSDKVSEPLRSRQLLTHLLPWKRVTHRRSVWRASASSFNSSSMMKTRKLLSSRNQAVVYVRSGRGFSLRRSKVISLAGSLKWSKSMEKRSKKVDEEAALAVAVSNSTTRPKTGASGVRSEAGIRKLTSHKSVNGMKLHTGERIFRIGVFRYRMDPSRRTLQRIPDEEAPDSTTSEAECARKSYVPKRLLIGSDEYVRIGNGNQLVRDPKRRTRILASEKVRWSLHTARLRLAKKRKFCQFFTRFGRCNKSEGKCPYIHDSSKIAVCTKFLKGLCVDPDCKLTHKVIPDRMPDCSFFLQGSCSNESCPYRHVNVNPKASICENFLRGYCAEGKECQKKHSYLCPEFEATGSCPQGSKCRLYHPKKGVSKKGKISEDEENIKVRYFDLAVYKPESETVILEKDIASKNSGVASEGGDLGDYISLDVSDDETEESTYPENKVTYLSEFAAPKNIDVLSGGNLGDYMDLDQAEENQYPNMEMMYLSEFDVLCSPLDDADELSKE